MDLINLILHLLENSQLAALSSVLTIPVLVYLIREFKKFKKDKGTTDNGVLALLENKLTNIHSKAIECKDDVELLSDSTLKSFFKCFEAYKELGGNGYIDRMKDDMDAIRDKKLMGGK